MKVAVIGTGYVGLVSGTCFAEIGHDVTCLDIDQKKLAKLKSGVSPIYEPGLNELLERNIKGKRLHFTDDFSEIKNANCIFLAVGTPSDDFGRADLTYLKAAAKSVALNLSEGAIVVIKSTVPVGTNKVILELMNEFTSKKFYLVNNPEFLKEGSAVEDFMRPDRVIIGHKEKEAADMMEELYAPLLKQGNPIYLMSNLSAEMSKYAANCFLATKISFINEIAKLCDLTGADISEVRKGMSSDKRIGPHFLYPGPGYGGSCFPKDVKALIQTAKENGMELSISMASEKVNDRQKTYLFEKMEAFYKGDFANKTFCFWGVAFKANTDDVRESPAIFMAEKILNAGGKIKFFDPVASENFLKLIKEWGLPTDNISASTNKYDCLNEADALITMTEWREFNSPDWDEVKLRLKHQVIFDGRNLFDTQKVLKNGFVYFAIGKKVPTQIRRTDEIQGRSHPTNISP